MRLDEMGWGEAGRDVLWRVERCGEMRSGHV